MNEAFNIRPLMNSSVEGDSIEQKAKTMIKK